jgi:hypothetical protein
LSVNPLFTGEPVQVPRNEFPATQVASINTSGHKYGLVYPGVGWVVWRDNAALPEDLVFRVNYLGGNMPTFALNFSRPGSQVIAQYYTFIRLGFEGYQRVQQRRGDGMKLPRSRMTGCDVKCEPLWAQSYSDYRTGWVTGAVL